ncbi:FAD-dependent oxidoreductase [Streptomyces sp. NPDC002928]|uniref:NAD(P)/FAD-dependent oxidoreductase n=1 Tax=Streptomyces sp. NPDC002928 TaxID=3154440 RepID=UPI0033AC1BC9
MSRTLVIVGHGMVGHRLADTLRREDRDQRWRTIVLGEESRPAYNRIALSSCFEGTHLDALTLPDGPAPAGPAPSVALGTRVVAIDREAGEVVTSPGGRIAYDALVLATGARPFVPPVPGHDLAGCFTFRTADDVRAIRKAAAHARSGVVVGGGLLGLEAASALRLSGLRTQVVEGAPHLLAAQIDPAAGALVARQIEQLGITVHCGTALASIEAGPDGSVSAVRLGDGAELAADLVVFAAGVRPADELAGAAGLDRGERGGFRTDDRCRTADPRIWAVGDCAAVAGRAYGLLAPGYRMADAVASQLLGDDAVFPGADTSTALKVLGVQVASFGDAQARTPGAVEVALERTGSYLKLVLDAELRTLLGGVLAGDTSAYRTFLPLVGQPLPPLWLRESEPHLMSIDAR